MVLCQTLIFPLVKILAERALLQETGKVLESFSLLLLPGVLVFSATQGGPASYLHSRPREEKRSLGLDS